MLGLEPNLMETGVVRTVSAAQKALRLLRMNSTKVQNPRRKMQVALLAEPKTPPGVERVYIIL